MGERSRINRRDVLGATLAPPLGVLATPGRLDAARCGRTRPQTSGPFFPVFAQVDKDVDLTRLTGHDEPAAGTVIRVQGRVLDDACQPVAGALVDLWQAPTRTDATRTRPTPTSTGARTRPGAIAPPHIHFRVSKRGHRELSAQTYFAGEALNEADLVIARG